MSERTTIKQEHVYNVHVEISEDDFIMIRQYSESEKKYDDVLIEKSKLIEVITALQKLLTHAQHHQDLR